MLNEQCLSLFFKWWKRKSDKICTLACMSLSDVTEIQKYKYGQKRWGNSACVTAHNRFDCSGSPEVLYSLEWRSSDTWQMKYDLSWKRFSSAECRLIYFISLYFKWQRNTLKKTCLLKFWVYFHFRAEESFDSREAETSPTKTRLLKLEKVLKMAAGLHLVLQRASQK